MKDLYNLKESLINELSDYGKKGGLTASSLDIIDKLAHAAKNVSKVIECCESDEYSKYLETFTVLRRGMDVDDIFINVTYVTIFFTVLVQGLTVKNVYFALEKHKSDRMMSKRKSA